MNEYDLKNDPLTLNRLRKIAKQVIENGKADRKLALETFEFFKTRVEAGNDNEAGTCKKCMIDCLKLVQGSKVQTTKLVTDLLKREGLVKRPKDSEQPSDLNFDDLLKQLEEKEDD